MSLIRALALLLCVLPLWAGQSLDLHTDTATIYWSHTPARPSTSDYMIELELANITAPGAYNNLMYANAIGFRIEWLSTNVLRVSSMRDSMDSPCDMSMAGRTHILLRARRDYEPTNAKFTTEIWNVDASGYSACERPITPIGWGATGGELNGTNINADIGFFRAFSTLVPVKSRPPVTADTGDLFEFRFDGNGNDSSGAGHNFTGMASYGYAATPGQVAYALPATPNTPAAFAYVPLRAGYPSQLASNSYSMADASAAVTCFWQQIPHAAGEALSSQVTFDDRTSCTPTLTGLVFGAYQFRLTVTDAAGTKGTADFPVGAVAYDDNGVVIYPDERLYDLIGPQMVRGQNPWGWADERQYTITRQSANRFTVNGGTYEVPNLNRSVNGTPITGTVWWSETGFLTRTLYGIDTEFTKIFCGGVPGPANNNVWIVPNMPTPLWGGLSGVPRPLYGYVKSCTSDTEIEVTWYLESENDVAIASPGVTWGTFWNSSDWPSLRTGTVYASNGSTTLNGTGTDFANIWCGGGTSPVAGAGVMIPGAKLTVTGATNATPIVVSLSSTHGLSDGAEVTLLNVGGNTAANGTYFARVSVEGSSTSVALYRRWSGGTFYDAAVGNGTYTSGGTLQSAMTNYGITGCPSATQATLAVPYSGVTISGPGGGWIPNRAPLTDQGIWNGNAAWTSTYYDTGAAYAREYLRSGDLILRNAARYVALNQWRTPYWAQWIFRSEQVISTILSAVVEPEIWEAVGMDPWPMIASRNANCSWQMAQNYPTDQREGAFCVWSMALTALYHPNPTTRATYRGYLVNHYNNQANVFQLPNGGYYSWYPSQEDTGRVWQVANGSTTATLYSGAAIDGSYCGTEFQPGGTASVDATGYLLTGTGTNWSGTANKYVILIGTLSGQPHMEVSQIAASPTPTGTGVTLVYPWRGDSGALTKVHVHSSGYPVQSFQAVTSANALPTHARMDTDSLYYCTVLSTSQIQFYKPYTGDTSAGDVYRRASAGGPGLFSPWFRQPFMDGLRADAYALAAKALAADDPTTSAGYMSKVHDLVSLLYTGRDTLSNGQPYFDNVPTCGPRDPTKPTICDAEVTTCGSERDYSMEGITGFARNYLYTNDPADLSVGDEFYRLLYAKPGYAAPVAGDGCYASYPETALGTAQEKALGQAFGHGGGSEWPAARVGGPAAPQLRDYLWGFALPASAVDVQVTKYLPNGESAQQVCTTSPCTLTGVDVRAGGPAMSYCYRASGGAALACADSRFLIPK